MVPTVPSAVIGAFAVTCQVLPPSEERATLWAGGLIRSPPPVTPWNASRKATLKMPAAAPPPSAELYAAHVSPPSRVASTRGVATPPVPIHARFPPCTATQVPLEANPDSPGCAAGRLAPMLTQSLPSVVRSTGNTKPPEPLGTESLKASACFGVQKANAS